MSALDRWVDRWVTSRRAARADRIHRAFLSGRWTR